MSGICYIVCHSNRYTEQVYPLVILAQRLLADRIIQEGEVVPQLHFINAMEQHGEITPALYATKLQLRIPEVIVQGENKLLVHSSNYRTEKDPMAASVLKGERGERERGEREGGEGGKEEREGRERERGERGRG